MGQEAERYAPLCRKVRLQTLLKGFFFDAVQCLRAVFGGVRSVCGYVFVVMYLAFALVRARHNLCVFHHWQEL